MLPRPTTLTLPVGRPPVSLSVLPVVLPGDLRRGGVLVQADADSHPGSGQALQVSWWAGLGT